MEMSDVYISIMLGLDSSKMTNVLTTYKLFGFLGDVGGI